MTTPAEPRTAPPAAEQSAWKALKQHYAKIRKSHLRKLFAQDPERGDRLKVEALGIYLDYSKNRITDETLQLLFAISRGIRPAGEDRRHVPRRQDQHHGEPLGSARGVARAQRRHRSSWMARTWFQACMRCSTRWPRCQTACEAAIGRVTPARPFATSSTSGSEAPILDRSWRMRPFATTASAT